MRFVRGGVPAGGDWHYTGNPADSNRDWVRWRIGDTDEQDHLQSDQEIAAALASESSRLLAAAACSEAIAAYFSRSYGYTKSDGAGNNETVQRQQRIAHYRTLAKELRDEADREGTSLGVPYAGGLSIAENETWSEDTDLLRSPLALGMQDAK